jgi:hypothetical protein
MPKGSWWCNQKNYLEAYEDIIKMDFRDISWGGINRINLA